MKWQKLPPYEGKIYQGCGCCPPVERVAPLDMVIAVGFGVAQVTRDNELVFQEQPDDERLRTLAEFEEMAKQDPDHDWRVLLVAPLRSREYQRHDDGKWVLIDSGPGFA